MKDFNLEEAKQGKPIITRDGREVKFLVHIPEVDESCRILALPENYTMPVFYHENGRFLGGVDNNNDLFMKYDDKPILYPLPINTKYYYPSFDTHDLTEETIWKDSTKDYLLSKRALVFLEREGARKQAFKMIDTLNKNDY